MNTVIKCPNLSLGVNNITVFITLTISLIFTKELTMTVSDGKPDDYDNYCGEYGIAAIRCALIEARREAYTFLLHYH